MINLKRQAWRTGALCLAGVVALSVTGVSPEELEGKSGHVVIRYDYTNTQYETRQIAGKEEKIYVPFAVMTGMILSPETIMAWTAV